MASTYSPKLRLELIGAGEQAGLWGTTTNKNLGTLLEQAIAGVTTVELDGISGNYTLTALDGAPDQSRSAVIKCTYAAAPASGTVNLIIPTQTKLYVVRNDCGQIVNVKTSAQVGGVQLKDGESTLVFCDGTNAIPGIQTEAVGTLTVPGGGTGATSFTAGFIKSPGGTGTLTSSSTVNASTEVSGTLPVANGGTGATTATNARTNLGLGTLSTLNSVSLTSNVTGTLPVGNGGTGQISFTAGRMLIGNGTGNLATLGGTVNGQVATWDNTLGTWTAASPASAGVSSFSAGTTGLTPSTATTGAVTLSGTLATGSGGTGLNGVAPFVAANNALYSTSSSALTAGTLPILAGGTGSTTAPGARTNLGATTVGSNLFTLTNPSAITFPRFNADNTVSTLNASDFRTAIGNGTVATLNSVSLTTNVTGVLPLANGGNGVSAQPAFQAVANANQLLTNGTATTTILPVENFDIGGCFNNSGTSSILNGITVPAYSFGPNVAGYYQVIMSYRYKVGDNTPTYTSAAASASLFKNGIAIYQACDFVFYNVSNQFSHGVVATTLVYLNGVSDTITMGVGGSWSGGGSSGISLEYPPLFPYTATRFEAFWVRP